MNCCFQKKLGSANILKVPKKILQYLLLWSFVDGDGLDIDFRTVSRAYSSSLLRVIISRNHSSFFQIFSNFVHFCPYFQILCPFLPYFALFLLFFGLFFALFFWKVARMPLLSVIGLGKQYKVLSRWSKKGLQFSYNQCLSEASNSPQIFDQQKLVPVICSKSLYVNYF